MGKTNRDIENLALIKSYQNKGVILRHELTENHLRKFGHNARSATSRISLADSSFGYNARSATLRFNLPGSSLANTHSSYTLVFIVVMHCRSGSWRHDGLKLPAYLQEKPQSRAPMFIPHAPQTSANGKNQQQDSY
jgi:hypothetical protein